MTISLGALVIRGNLFILLCFLSKKTTICHVIFFMFFKGNLDF
jgi:hypothetical protein